RLLGWARLVVLYAVSALGGGVLSGLLHDRTLAAGASGAGWGRMAGEIVLLLRTRRRAGPEAVPVRPLVIAQPLLFNLIFSLQRGIDLAAHLGGGIAGGAFMALLALPLRRNERAWRGAALACASVLGLAVAIALLVGRPWVPLPRDEVRSASPDGRRAQDGRPASSGHPGQPRLHGAEGADAHPAPAAELPRVGADRGRAVGGRGMAAEELRDRVRIAPAL